jgi:hypothetical protein
MAASSTSSAACPEGAISTSEYSRLIRSRISSSTPGLELRISAIEFPVHDCSSCQITGRRVASSAARATRRSKIDGSDRVAVMTAVIFRNSRREIPLRRSCSSSDTSRSDARASSRSRCWSASAASRS